MLPRLLPRVLLSAAVFLIAMALYISTATPGMITGGMPESESAELQRAANRLGIAHSTGYPLYTMIGYGAARVGEALGGDRYTWITYTSALGSSIALVMFFQLALMIASPPAALAATAVLAVTDSLWHVSTITEVQGLNALVIVGILWLAVVHLRYPDRFMPLAGVALLAGIGLANHRTAILTLPAAGLAVLFTDVWRRLSLRRWLILVAAFVLPLLSYGYIVWRATDAYVAFSIRPTWWPSGLSAQNIADLITGRLLSGDSININITLPFGDFGERLGYVFGNLAGELTPAGLIAALIGLALLTWKNWRLGLMQLASFAAWIFFLMSWRLDGKAILYYHAAVYPLALGLAALASWALYGLGLKSQAKQAKSTLVDWTESERGTSVHFSGLLMPRRRLQSAALLSPIALALYSLPVFALAFFLFGTNLPEQDRSGDHRGEEYRAQMAELEPSMLFTGGWVAESFILLETMDDAGLGDMIPVGPTTMEHLLNTARDLNQTVYIGPSWRSAHGMYAGATDIPAQGFALSGTHTDLFLQVRPRQDPRLPGEAGAADIIVRVPVTQEIMLYSVDLTPTPDGLRIALYWSPLRATDNTYSTYTHLRHNPAECVFDPQRTRLLAQDDASAPVESSYPTNFWEPGEFVKDTYFIPWPEEPLPAENVALVIGMTLNGQRRSELCLSLQESDINLDWPIDFAALGVEILEE